MIDRVLGQLRRRIRPLCSKRGGFVSPCTSRHVGFYIHVGYDYYVYVGSGAPSYRSLKWLSDSAFSSIVTFPPRSRPPTKVPSAPVRRQDAGLPLPVPDATPLMRS